jgi:hypothetical protein
MELYEAGRFGFRIGDKTNKDIADILTSDEPAVVYVREGDDVEVAAFNYGNYLFATAQINTEPILEINRTERRLSTAFDSGRELDKLENFCQTKFYLFEGRCEDIVDELMKRGFENE